MVGLSDERMWQEQREFGRILETIQNGPLLYKATDNLPFGKAWNTDRNFAKGKSCSRWASGLEGIRLVAPFEIPYANAGGQAVTPRTARAFGRSLARALRRYLERIDAAPDAPKAKAPLVPAGGVVPRLTVMAKGLGSDSKAGIGASMPWADKDGRSTVYFMYN